MSNITWKDNHIEVEVPKSVKKITGTRLASILGYNKWSTPFQAFCEITKAFEKPFADTIYTVAGKTIEPKQAQYLKDRYHMDIVTPTEKFGADYFNKTRGDFFNDNIFGGMWDYLEVDENGKVNSVIECKTTQRTEDWKDGHIPTNYALQAALYAYLLGTDNVIMVCSFLTESDYTQPEKYVPSMNNTIIIPFSVSDYIPNFNELVDEAVAWWNRHIVTGISPDYDETKDKDFLDELRKNTLNPTTDISKLAEEYDSLALEVAEIESSYEDKLKRLDQIKKIIKEYLTSNLRDGDKKSTFASNKFNFTLAITERKVIDEDLLKKDGLYDRYLTVKQSERFTTSQIKEDK